MAEIIALLHKVCNKTITRPGSLIFHKGDYSKDLEEDTQRNVGKYDEHLLFLGLGTNDDDEASNMVADL